MPDIFRWISALDTMGRGITDALVVSSIEASILGAIVWCMLRFDRGYAPWLRHMLWLAVIIKPMTTLMMPWQGPLPLPNLSSAAAVRATGLAESSNWVVTHVYAVVASIWITAVAIGVVWTCTGLGMLLFRARRTMPVTVPWVQALFDRCLTIAGVNNRMRLVMSDHFASPTMIVLGRPIVVVPSWCLIHLSPQELKQVFLHELSHYRRRDHLTILLVQIARICFFFHPLVWYAGRRLDIEAERACDMAVVSSARKPHSYASSLLKVAEGAVRARWHGVLEMVKSASTTALRIREVLSGLDERRYVIHPRMMPILFLCGVVCLLPIFHIPIPRIIPVPEISVTPQILPLSDPIFIESASPAHPDAQSTDTDPALDAALPVLGRISMSKIDTNPVLNLLESGVPYARQSVTATLLASSETPSAPDRTGAPNSIHPSVLGLPSEPSLMGRALKDASGWNAGQIEVQGGGYAYSPNEMSLRAGYFVTRSHELGGVLSVIGTGSPTLVEAIEEHETPASLLGLPDDQSARARRIAALPPQFDSSPALDEERIPDEQTLMIGGFYRYNLAGISGSLVPFVGMGAGVEVRSGRNPILIDGGGGVRYFLSKHAALIMQVDYIKDVELSTRTRVNTSLGISTIF